MKMRDN